jgi:hypothetical protein
VHTAVALFDLVNQKPLTRFTLQTSDIVKQSLWDGHACRIATFADVVNQFSTEVAKEARVREPPRLERRR